MKGSQRGRTWGGRGVGDRTKFCWPRSPRGSLLLLVPSFLAVNPTHLPRSIRGLGQRPQVQAPEAPGPRSTSVLLGNRPAWPLLFQGRSLSSAVGNLMCGAGFSRSVSFAKDRSRDDFEVPFWTVRCTEWGSPRCSRTMALL